MIFLSDVSTMESCNQEPKLLHEFFEASASRYPDHCAIEWYSKNSNTSYEKRYLTYRQLSETTERLSKTLSRHVHKESIVAILLPRVNERAYVAQLASNKAGAAYLCIDPMFPDERIKFILSDANPVAIVTDRDSYARLKSCMVETNTPVIVYEEWENNDTAEDEGVNNAIYQITENNLAYVIYTSGSTGKPKGVLVEHRNISNLIRSNLSYFSKSVDSNSRVGQQASLSFDASVFEISLAFAFGGTLVVIDDKVVRSGPDLPLWLIKERVNVMLTTPTLLRTMGPRASSQLTQLNYLCVGGEELTKDIADVWSRGRHMENL